MAWYDREKRTLPWRQDQDAYKIWVSEIMLQQTRVEAVKEYFARWMERFPTLDALAAADEEEVMRYWQGLGYYARARNLLKGVREVRAQYGGKVPDDPEAVKQIPGIGEYTAGAILSIAYNRRQPAVDGNVLRVFARLYAIGEDIGSTAVKRKIRSLAAAALPDDRPGDFNQALMDLGSAVCIPKHPRCGQCPLQAVCDAFDREIQDTLPVKQPKALPVEVPLATGILSAEGAYLARKRPVKGILAGMWEFPTVEIAGEQTGPEALSAFFREELGQTVVVNACIGCLTHTFSHRRWQMEVYRCQAPARQAKLLPDAARWIPVGELESYTWAGPHRKILKWLTQPTLMLDD